MLHDGEKLHYFSFQFSTGEVGPREIISPALGTYKVDPWRKDPVPPYPETVKVIFDTWRNAQKENMLYGFRMVSERGENVIHIRPSNKASRHHKTQVLDLRPGERICSASVTISAKRFQPIYIQFMVYDLV